MEDTIQAAYQILFFMNDELCSSALWSKITVVISHSNAINGDYFDCSHLSEMGGRALNVERLCYKPVVSSLRVVLTAIPNYKQEETYEIGFISGRSESHAVKYEIKMLEEQATNLRVADSKNLLRISQHGGLP